MVSDSGTSGVDVVLSSRSYTLGAGIETLILTGTTDLNGTETPWATSSAAIPAPIA
ncbi:MAG: hypothetical protein HZT43_16840 [Exiguobacterium profundum]|nr:MAG: hypothetical protein HZT43_16840 [Exiguobacterium profundum]